MSIVGLQNSSGDKEMWLGELGDKGEKIFFQGDDSVSEDNDGEERTSASKMNLHHPDLKKIIWNLTFVKIKKKQEKMDENINKYPGQRTNYDSLIAI